MIDAQNRTPLPGKEGRVTLALDDGTTLGGILSMADEATQEGTPWDRDTARKLQADIRTYPVAAGQSIAAGDVVDVVGGRVTTRKAQVGGLAIGTIIKLNENGNPVDYIVVHHGKPSAIYDDSCDGTWILRKDILLDRQWDDSDNNYGASTINTYLNGTMLTLFDSSTLSAIKQVKIPYVNGTGGSAVASGASGLSVKGFLLSGLEVGFTDSRLSIDGAILSYFISGTTAEANNKRIGYLNGTASAWWNRSPLNTNNYSVECVFESGSGVPDSYSSLHGVRPAFVLDDSFDKIEAVEPSQAIALTTAAAGADCEVIYSGVASLPGITVGQKITSGGVYGVGVLDGVLQVWSKDRPGQVVTGSYTGTGTYGSSHPNIIALPVKPKFVFVTNTTASAKDWCAFSLADGSVLGVGTGYANSTNIRMSYTEISDNGISWYWSGSSAQQNYQLNISGNIYAYIAIL